MKLRIQENSLRLRLTRKEVTDLCESGRVESFIELVPGAPLLCMLESSSQVATVTASFNGQMVHVAVPANVVMDWAGSDRGSDRVSIEGQSQGGVQLLVEKDFHCLHKPGEQDPDASPHPLMVSGEQGTSGDGLPLAVASWRREATWWCAGSSHIRRQRADAMGLAIPARPADLS